MALRAQNWRNFADFAHAVSIALPLSPLPSHKCLITIIHCDDFIVIYVIDYICMSPSWRMRFPCKHFLALRGALGDKRRGDSTTETFRMPFKDSGTFDTWLLAHFFPSSSRRRFARSIVYAPHYICRCRRRCHRRVFYRIVTLLV